MIYCPQCNARSLSVVYEDIASVEYQLVSVESDGSVNTGNLIDVELHNAQPQITCPDCGIIPESSFHDRFWVNYVDNEDRPDGMVGLVDDEAGGEIAWFHSESTAGTIADHLNSL